jgi:hypothetical protein
VEPFTVAIIIALLLIFLIWATARMTTPGGASQQAFDWMEDAYWKHLSGEEGRDDQRRFGTGE